MKVLHLVSRYRWTGCAEPAVNLCRFLAAAGVDSRLCCVPGGSLEREARELGTLLAPATALGRNYTPWGILSAARRLARYVASEGIDLLHAHTSHDHWLAGLSTRLSASPAVPLVRTHHETRRIRTGRVWRRIFNEYTAANVAVSLASREFLTGSGAIRPEKIRTIYGGLDFSRFRVREAAPDVRAAWGVPPEAKLVAHLSHIGPDRRQKVMLEAFSLLAEEIPRMWLIFLGQGNRDTVHHLKRRVASGSLGHRIRFSRDFAEKALPWPNQIAAADLVAVLAVGSEGSSRGVMEAMALAKPVIGSGLGVIPELLEEGKTGWIVDPNEPSQVAGAIRQALTDQAKSLRLGSAASVAVRTRFRCERQAQETLELYREIVRQADRSLPAAGSR